MLSRESACVARLAVRQKRESTVSKARRNRKALGKDELTTYWVVVNRNCRKAYKELITM